LHGKAVVVLVSGIG